jgi:hypothetical protein
MGLLPAGSWAPHLQLSRQDGVDAVLVTPWQWDGRERRRMAAAV